MRLLNNLFCGTGIAALSFAVGVGAVLSPLGTGLFLVGAVWEMLRDK